jgi:uncharacterized membrane protein YphA (DoxX/SURF4 family)
MLAALPRWRDEVGETYVLGAVRVALGLLLLANGLRAARELEDVFFGDVFHWPMLPEWCVPSRAIYIAIVIVEVFFAALVVVGHWARAALFGCALAGIYVLLCDRLQFHHNRWALFCYALLLSLSPCDRSFCLARESVGPRIGPLWAARLAQLQISIVYVASSGWKLLDADWRGGRVLLERFHFYAPQAIARGVPPSVMGVLSRPEVASMLAKLAIGTELFLAVGLWHRRTRLFALCCGVGFHLLIEATSRVESFTWLTLAMYALFLIPTSPRVSSSPLRP